MIEAGFPEDAVDSLTDSDMTALASDLAEDYCDQLFWNSLKVLGAETIEESEVDRVNETPIKQLPLLIGSLISEAGKEALEKKLKT